MNAMMLIGILLIVIGVALLAVSQLILIRWIKRYNREWMGDVNEMS